MHPLLLLCLLCVGNVLSNHVGSTPKEPQMGLMIDAGSSGSRIYVYEWEKRTGNELPDATPAPYGQSAWSLKMEPGVSAYAYSNVVNGLTLSAYLRNLTDYAATKVPVEMQAKTELYLFATAGMRLVPANLAHNLYDAIRRELQASPFKFVTAKTLSGEEEGVFGWDTMNMLEDTFDLSRNQTWAALDLGGASTQITFAPTENPMAGFYDHRIGVLRYPLYTHSYLNFGADRLRVLLLQQFMADGEQSNPCDWKGYVRNEANGTFVGLGDPVACKAKITRLLRLNETCDLPPCAIGGVYVPELPADMKIVLFSAFAYTATFFNCSGDKPLNCIDTTATPLCASTTFAQANTLWGGRYLENWCLQAAYIHLLLTKAYHLSETRMVRYASIDKDHEITWAMGAMMAETASTVICPATNPTTIEGGNNVININFEGIFKGMNVQGGCNNNN